MRYKEFSEAMPEIPKTGMGPNAKVGSQPAGQNNPGQNAQAQQNKSKMGEPDSDDSNNDFEQQLKPGGQLELTNTKGQKQSFKVSKISGDEVEIENPEAKKSPSQPEKIIYKKEDLKLAGQQTNANR
jgi:hypothetical protein